MDDLSAPDDPSAPSLPEPPSPRLLAIDDSDEPTATVPPRDADASAPGRGSGRRIFAEGERVAGVYEIGEVIGSGGMGQVFAAVDRSLDRDVALKACWPRVGRSVLRAEARAMAAMRHPGIVTIHTMGVHRGVDFLVMERLHGRTLHEHVQQRKRSVPFSVEEALEILVPVADAVATVHRAGFIHRDLKPANIMLTQGRQPVLLDLGVSFRTEELDQENRMAGSPHYIAPEVVGASIRRGQAHLIDIYALGIIAFEMLVGRRPFENEETVNLLEMHLHLPAPRVSEHVSGIPLQLDRLIAQMMRKRPSERPPSAMVVAARLRELQRGAQRGGRPGRGTDRDPPSFSRVFG